MNRAFRYLLLVATLLASLASAQAPKPSQEELRRQTFEIVWQNVNDRYYDPTFGGVDWAAIKTKYEPLVAAAKSQEEFHGLLNKMLGELKRSHFAVIPPSVYLAEEKVGKGERDAEAGAVIQLVEGRPTVVRTEPGYPAAVAGLKPGYVVVKIGKTKLADVLKGLQVRKERPERVRFLLSAVAESMLAGKAGQSIAVQALDGRNRLRTYTLKLKKAKGLRIKFGELPALYGWVSSKRLPHNVGYVGFNIFLMPILQKIQDAMDSHRSARALIIDLRGNPGGLGAMAVPIARKILSKQVLLGTMAMRGGEIRLLVSPDQNPFKGPVAVLTDEGTGSTSELFAGGLQEAGRIVTVGGTTAGAVLPSTFVKLPDGSRLQSAFADFKTPKGVLLEGRGVFADVPVKITRKALLAGRDPVLDKAVAVLNQKSKGR